MSTSSDTPLPLPPNPNPNQELVLAPVQTYRDHGLVLRGLRHGGSRFASSVFVEGMSLASQLLLFSQVRLGVRQGLG